MPSALYLDAARMGQMTPSTQWALHDFVRLAGEEGCTLYFDQFFRDGFSAWPATFRQRFPNLRCWGGVNELKKSLAAFVGLPADARPLLAARSANLMKLAARLLFRGGKPVVATDLAWPSYQRVLEREARQANTHINCLPMRTGILRRRISVGDVVGQVVARIVGAGAGGLFLPAISHDGIRLPIDEIVAAVRQLGSPVFIAVDGSQAFGQMPLDLSRVRCDFFLAGCHKWFGGHLPLGIAFCPNPETHFGSIAACNRLIDSSRIDDPLLAFLQTVETGRQRRFTETVNLSPLFACRGALEDQLIEGPLSGRHRRRLANAHFVRRLAHMTAWIPLVPAEEYRSASVLLQSTDPLLRRSDPNVLREHFHERGIALTAYKRGIIRLSMPSVPFSTAEAGLLIQALALVHHPARPRFAAQPLALSA